MKGQIVMTLEIKEDKGPMEKKTLGATGSKHVD